jgi:hypothetical protein
MMQFRPQTADRVSSPEGKSLIFGTLNHIRLPPVTIILHSFKKRKNVLTLLKNFRTLNTSLENC